MLTLYGIKNCDTMQKAFKWLDTKGVAYQFHDYRVDGIDRATIEHWLQHLPLNKVINSRSTTYRELSDTEKAATTNKSEAMELMMKHNSIIKRPVWDFGNGKFFLGWNEKEIEKLL